MIQSTFIAMGGGRKPRKKISIINYECVNYRKCCYMLNCLLLYGIKLLYFIILSCLKSFFFIFAAFHGVKKRKNNTQQHKPPLNRLNYIRKSSPFFKTFHNKLS